MRENIPLAEKKYGIAFHFDISLPISNITEFIKKNKSSLKMVGLQQDIIIFGHLGDGNLHYNIPIKSELSHTEVAKITHIVYNDVVSLGGSISAEHGIGQLKKEYFKQFYDSGSFTLAKSIKNLIDPNNTFNPSKIF